MREWEKFNNIFSLTALHCWHEYTHCTARLSDTFNATLSAVLALSRGSFFSLRGTSLFARRRASVATRNAAPILHLVLPRASCIAGVHHYALSHVVMGTSADPVKGLRAETRVTLVVSFVIAESGPSDPPSWQVDDPKSYAAVINLFHEILKVVQRQKLRPIRPAKFARIYVTVSRDGLIKNWISTVMRSAAV